MKCLCTFGNRLKYITNIYLDLEKQILINNIIKLQYYKYFCTVTFYCYLSLSLIICLGPIYRYRESANGSEAIQLMLVGHLRVMADAVYLNFIHTIHVHTI